MPCLSTGYDDDAYERDQIKSLQKDVDHLEAALCRALTFIEAKSSMETFFAESDWVEAGVSAAQVASWWKSHKKKDVKRKKAEEAAARKAVEDKARFRVLSSNPWSALSKNDRAFLNQYSD
jgi:hypothetical protein